MRYWLARLLVSILSSIHGFAQQYGLSERRRIACAGTNWSEALQTGAIGELTEIECISNFI